MPRLGISRTILAYSPVIKPLVTCCFSWPCGSSPWKLLPLCLSPLPLYLQPSLKLPVSPYSFHCPITGYILSLIS